MIKAEEEKRHIEERGIGAQKAGRRKTQKAEVFRLAKRLRGKNVLRKGNKG